LKDATEELFNDIIPRAASSAQIKNFFLNYFPSVMLELDKVIKIFYIDNDIGRLRDAADFENELEGRRQASM
jgi:hypothetical protein